MNEYKIHARGWIERHAQDISDWHQIIWRLAEPAWREYRSAAWYVDRLRKEGFTVEEGSAGMPTAFCAVWENGKGGPTVGAYAEYDATPANSQEQVPYECPREGLNRYAAGHTDPHSALGMGSLAGVLAAKDAMRRYGIPGRIKFFGEPAEKMCGSKPLHAANGYYDDVDAFISFHPSCRLSLCNTVYWDIHCGSSYGRVFTFECTHPETWGEAHGRMLMPLQQVVARAPGALDAVCLMYTTSRYTNTSMLPRSGGWYISEAILVGGQATADHLARASGRFTTAGARPRWKCRTASRKSSRTTPSTWRRSRTAKCAATGCRRTGSACRTTRWRGSPTATWSWRGRRSSGKRRRSSGGRY